jgi:hypothetical protein
MALASRRNAVDDRVTRFTERGVMPKTKINYPEATVEVLSDLAGGMDIGNGATVQVGWDKAGKWVQVGFDVAIGYAMFAAASPTSPGRTSMWTPVLTAKEIDLLIKTLRKAKRQTA